MQAQHPLAEDNFLITAEVGGAQEESSNPTELRKQRPEFGAVKANGTRGVGCREKGVI